MSILRSGEHEGITNAGPKVVALTGGIGGGKSTARRVFEEFGVPCIDADQVARNIHQDPNHPATAELALTFPSAVTFDGGLIRGSLRTLFAIDEKANMKLRRILKPYVMAEVERWTHQMNASYVVWESALMVEEDIRSDRVLVVDASDEVRIARIQVRNPDWTVEQIRIIFAIQFSRSRYAAKANDVINNDGTDTDLRAQIERLHHLYVKQWS